MKRVFLLIVVPALLVTLGFAQTPAANGNTDQVNVKGCLAGSDGNYSVVEDNTGKIFKITTSSADLKPHVGHDVNLVGQKAANTENSFSITEVSMISEHCTAAAAPAATASAPAETASTPPAPAVVPAAAAPDPTASAPAEIASTPPAPVVVPTVSEPPVTAPAATEPAAAVITPLATVSAPAETASAPAVAAPVHRAQPSARPAKPAATPAAAAAPAEPVSTPAAHEVVPVAPEGPSPETASTPAAVAPKTSMSRSAGMIIAIVAVLLIGAGVPLYNRWRRRKLAEQTKGENLSFTKEAKTDPGKTDTTGGRKAA